MQIDHVVSQLCFNSHHKSNMFMFPNFLKHLGEIDLNHYDNLFPSCRQCNFYKSANNIEMFRANIITMHKRIMKPFISRLGAKYGIIEIKEWDGVFHFEKVMSYNQIEKTK